MNKLNKGYRNYGIRKKDDQMSTHNYWLLLNGNYYDMTYDNLLNGRGLYVGFNGGLNPLEPDILPASIIRAMNRPKRLRKR